MLSVLLPPLVLKRYTESLEAKSPTSGISEARKKWQSSDGFWWAMKMYIYCRYKNSLLNAVAAWDVTEQVQVFKKCPLCWQEACSLDSSPATQLSCKNTGPSSLNCKMDMKTVRLQMTSVWESHPRWTFMQSFIQHGFQCVQNPGETGLSSARFGLSEE
jgi:hypothetical protein